MATFPSKLSAGVYGRLEFDFACNRGHNFGESHLQGVLNEIAASNFDSRKSKVESGYAAPALQIKGRKGRNREVDLAILDRDSGSITYALEAKWANSTHCKDKTILKDLCRLAAIHKADPTIVCLFVLAGGKDAVQKVLKQGMLAPHGPRQTRLLSYPYFSYPRKFQLSRANLSQHRDDIEKILPWVPARISSLLHKPSHEDTPNWTVLVWRIRA